jgi:hypothetical protein
LREDGARMLLIDTSTEPPMVPARALYEALGYARATLIPDYWGPATESSPSAGCSKP